MVNDILVSVVITTYKRACEVLWHAVDSVINQTYKNIEVIVVDDNGAGTSYQIQNEKMLLNTPKVKYIINDINSGAQFSRNRGILSSSGSYLAFLDDDDWWELDKIQKQVQLFSPNVGLVFCNGFIVDDNSENKNKLYRPLNKDAYFEKRIDFSMMLADDCIGSTSQVLIKKECFAKAGLFDVEMPARQDYEMWIRISRYYDLYGTSEALFYHRIHSGEQISKNSTKVIIGYKKILKKYQCEFQKDRFAKARMVLRIAFVNFKSKDWARGIAYSLLAFLVSPSCFFYKLANNSLIKRHR